MHKKKLLLAILFISFSFLFVRSISFAETITPTDATSGTPTPTTDNSQQVSDIQNKINDIQNKINDAHTQEKTLSSQISVMDNQISLTQYRIDQTQQQITQAQADIQIANKRIESLQGSLDNLTKVLLNRIVENYKVGQTQPIQVMLTAQDATDFVRKENYLRIAQEHDQLIAYDTVQAKNDYANQKDIFEQQKKKMEALQSQLEDYSKQLDTEKADKQRLLADTQGSEATYQKLLSQARAQLAGFSRFTASRGGASLLGNQTVCDSWGCYYNQRDSQWGSLALNNTQYSIASDGCLLTSMAMVYTHYGHTSVTPISINSNPNNFASYEPAWLSKTIVADGTSSTRISSSIDGELNSGSPVIVGISYDRGPYPDHFVVLISGSGGNYQMNDPYTPNGHNIAFSDKYSVGSIREIDRVSM
ncbi:MAG TPA: C39 family peptidase [Candidatus Saccharimonadales bacterium]|nr:C39 family peptidase [Candidatus Saccharimonadales bacterium]